MTITEASPVDNGVNVTALLGAREHMTEMPELAQFQWRADCKWVNGTHSRTTVNTFSGAGGEQSHRQPHSVETDHPELFASADNGMTPPELVLAGLAGCITAGVASVATNRGIQLRSVHATVEADMDLAEVSQCNCSICGKKGALHRRVTKECFRLLSGHDDLQLYQFNKKIARHQFCRHCGIHAFANPRSYPEQVLVNVRCLDDFDLFAAQPDVKLIDGRNWEQHFTDWPAD